MRQIKNKKLDALHTIISCFAIVALIFFAIGLKDIDNYQDWFLFSIAMIFGGILFGITLYIILAFFIPATKSYKNNKGIGLLFVLCVVFLLLFFGIGSLINESSNHNEECKAYVIQDIDKSTSSSRNFFILVNTGNKIERLSFGRSFNKAHNAGDTINLCLITGKLGFKYYKIGI